VHACGVCLHLCLCLCVYVSVRLCGGVVCRVDTIRVSLSDKDVSMTHRHRHRDTLILDIDKIDQIDQIDKSRYR